MRQSAVPLCAVHPNAVITVAALFVPPFGPLQNRRHGHFVRDASRTAPANLPVPTTNAFLFLFCSFFFIIFELQYGFAVIAATCWIYIIVRCRAAMCVRERYSRRYLCIYLFVIFYYIYFMSRCHFYILTEATKYGDALTPSSTSGFMQIKRYRRVSSGINIKRIHANVFTSYKHVPCLKSRVYTCGRTVDLPLQTVVSGFCVHEAYLPDARACAI